MHWHRETSSSGLSILSQLKSEARSLRTTLKHTCHDEKDQKGVGTISASEPRPARTTHTRGISPLCILAHMYPCIEAKDYSCQFPNVMTEYMHMIDCIAEYSCNQTCEAWGYKCTANNVDNANSCESLSETTELHQLLPRQPADQREYKSNNSQSPTHSTSLNCS